MVLYADLIFFSNALINYLFLYCVEKICKDKPNHGRIIAASIFGGLLIVCYFSHYYVLVAMKIMGGLLISLLGFHAVSMSKRVIKTALFYLFNYVLVGVLCVYKIEDWYFLLLCVVVVIVLILLENFKKYHIFLRRCEYTVTITFQDTTYHLKGFLDTGNFSKTPNGIPIIYMDNKYFYRVEDYEQIIVNTVNGTTILSAYRPNQCFVKMGRKMIKKEVRVVFTVLNQVECLLNQTMFL